MRNYEKMDFLMKLTNTSNTSLAKLLNFDSSYISRIRSGKRSFPKQKNFIEVLSSYFVKKIKEDNQKEILSEFISKDKLWHEDTIKKDLISWLSLDEDNFLEELAVDNFKTQSTTNSNLFYYGNQGKREIVKRFLEDVLLLDNLPKLILYSNEDFSWLYEDRNYAKKWYELIYTYLNKGGHITIVHTISRASGEMNIAIKSWLPLYKTGQISSYYYPKVLDRVFKKTMFVAVNYRAVVASSISNNFNEGINYYLSDLNAVNEVNRELDEFLKLCKPLITMYDITKRNEFIKLLFDFSKISNKMITIRNTPSLYTMPRRVAKSINSRCDSDIIKRQEICEKAFMEMTTKGSFIEIFNLVKLEDIKNNLNFPLCDIVSKAGVYYTLNEYKEHLSEVIHKLKTVDSYHVLITDKINKDEIILVKEDVGVILVKTDTPSLAFYIDETRMVASFYDYLAEMKNQVKDKAYIIDLLTKYLASLDSII